MSTRMSVSIVEDDVPLRELWQRKLDRGADFICAGLFTTAESALPALLAHPPMLALVDWKLPGPMDGIELIKRVKQAHPAVCVVLITSHHRDELPSAALGAGADGFLFKPVPLHELAPQLREALAGNCPVSDEAAQMIFKRLRASGALGADVSPAILSEKERETLELLGDGLSAKQAADRLGISYETAITYKNRAFVKLKAHSLAEALHRLRVGANLPGTTLKRRESKS